MSEETAVGTPVGAIMAAAVNQTIVYSITDGNQGGEQTLRRACCVLQLAEFTADKVAGSLTIASY